MLFSVVDVPRCCDVWNNLFSDWHWQRVDECSDCINMLFANNQKSNKKRKLTCTSSQNAKKNDLKSPIP